jgi:hypothetical protein
MLEAARVNPALRRRLASSRPSRCGIETTRGADILKILTSIQLQVIPHRSKKRAARVAKAEPYGFRFVFSAAERPVPTAGL